MIRRHRREGDPPAQIIWQLGSITVTEGDGACHACGRTNIRLTFSSDRARGGSMILCHLCVQEVLRTHREHMANHDRNSQP